MTKQKSLREAVERLRDALRICAAAQLSAILAAHPDAPEPGTPPEDEAALVALVTRVVREADEGFKKSGGTSRHWVRECFLPAMAEHGLTFSRAPMSIDTAPTDGTPVFGIVPVKFIDGEWRDWETGLVEPVQWLPATEAELDQLRASPTPASRRDETPTLTDAMIDQMMDEATKAGLAHGRDCKVMGITGDKRHELMRAVFNETIRSYLYQAGIMRAQLTESEATVARKVEAARREAFDAALRAFDYWRQRLGPDERLSHWAGAALVAAFEQLRDAPPEQP